MKVNKVLFLFLFSVVFSFTCYSMEQEKPEKQGVRVGFFFERFVPVIKRSKVKSYSDEERKLKTGEAGSTGALKNAIGETFDVIIASNVLVRNLWMIASHGFRGGSISYINAIMGFFNKDNKEWFVYATPDRRFGVFVRAAGKKLENIDWKKLGLTKPKAEDIMPANVTVKEGLKSLFEEKMEKCAKTEGGIKECDIDIKKLDEIFDDEGVVPTFDFVMGHGFYGGAGKKVTEKLKESIQIAQLTLQEFKEFLKNRQKRGCLFMFVISCFSGGLNLTLINKYVDQVSGKLSREKEIIFPIVVGGISDVTQIGANEYDFTQFFERLDIFFAKRIAAHGLKPEYTVMFEKPFRKIVEPLFLSIPELTNIPTVLLPGLDKPVKTIKVDKEVLVLTYPYLIKKELKGIKIRGETIEQKLEREEKERKERAKKLKEYREKLGRINEKLKIAKNAEQQKLESQKREIKKEIEAFYKEIQEKQRKLKELRCERQKAITKKDLEIGGKKAILIYPMILNIPLKFLPNMGIPKLVSMIPGQAHHHIRNIKAEDVSLKDLFENMFVTDFHLGYPKMFYLEKVTGVKNFNSSGILHPDNKSLDKSDQKLDIKNVFIFADIGEEKNVRGYFQVKEAEREEEKGEGEEGVENYRWVAVALKDSSFVFDVYKKDLFLLMHDIKSMIKSTKPFKSAMLDSSGGIESVKQFDKHVSDFLKKSGLELQVKMQKLLKDEDMFERWFEKEKRKPGRVEEISEAIWEIAKDYEKPQLPALLYMAFLFSREDPKKENIVEFDDSKMKIKKAPFLSNPALYANAFKFKRSGDITVAVTYFELPEALWICDSYRNNITELLLTSKKLRNLNGIEKLKKLRKITVKSKKLTRKSQELLKQLEERGVTVERQHIFVNTQ